MTQPTTKKPFTVAAMRHGGTHLITPIVRRFTNRPVYSPKGEASLNCIPSDIVIVFTRDPRNRVVSNLRYKLGAEAVAGMDAGDRDEALATFLKNRKDPAALTVIDFMAKWAAKWLREDLGKAVSRSMLVRFEDMAGPNSLVEVTRVGDFLAKSGAKLVATPAEAKAYSLGRSGTWTGSHSNYRQWFGPKAKSAWLSNFGQQCTIAMGYTPDQETAI